MGPVAKDLCDPAPVVAADEEAARAPEDRAVVDAGLPDGRRVDDGDDLLQVVDHHPVEEHLVAVLQVDEVDVLLDRVRLAAQGGEGPLLLLLDREDARRKEPPESEGVPFGLGERRPLVEEGVGEEGPLLLQRPEALPVCGQVRWAGLGCEIGRCGSRAGCGRGLARGILGIHGQSYCNARAPPQRLLTIYGLILLWSPPGGRRPRPGGRRIRDRVGLHSERFYRLVPADLRHRRRSALLTGDAARPSWKGPPQAPGGCRWAATTHEDLPHPSDLARPFRASACGARHGKDGRRGAHQA